MVLGLRRAGSERSDWQASATRAIRLGLWVLVLAGPVLATLALLADTTGPVRAQAPTARAMPVRSALGPSDFAVRFVSAWASASGSKGTAAVRAFFPDAPDAPISEPSSEVTGLRPAGAREVEPGYWAITVSGWTTPTDKDGDEGRRDGALRYWRVGVLAQGDAADGGRSKAGTTSVGYVATGLPAVVSAPGRSDGPGSPYGTAVDGAPGRIGSSVQGFLRLYLTGRSDAGRYLAPGVRLAPLEPAPFLDAEVVRLAAAGNVDLTVSATPADGQRVRVLATVRPHVDRGELPTLQYALSLTGRAGRWEISGLDPAPLLDEPRRVGAR